MFNIVKYILYYLKHFFYNLYQDIKKIKFKKRQKYKSLQPSKYVEKDIVVDFDEKILIKDLSPFYITSPLFLLIKEHKIEIFNNLVKHLEKYDFNVKIGIEIEFYTNNPPKNAIKEMGKKQYEIQMPTYINLYDLVNDFNKIKTLDADFSAVPNPDDCGSALQINLSLENTIREHKIYEFKDCLEQKDKQGNIQIHKIEGKYINNFDVKINELLQQKPVVDAVDNEFVGLNKIEIKNRVFEYFFEKYGVKINKNNRGNLEKFIIKHSEIGDIYFTKTSLKTSYSHSHLDENNYLVDKNKAIVFKYLDAIVKNAIVISKEINWKNREYNTYLTGTKIIINENEFIVESIIKELTDNTNIFYIHNVIEKEKFQELPISPLAKTQHLINNSTGTSTSNIINLHQNVNKFKQQYIKNLFARDENDSESQLLLNCVAGVLKNINNNLLLYVKDETCFKRFDLERNIKIHNNGGYPAPTFISWGINNRTSAIRIPTPKDFKNYKELDKKERRIEFRVPSANADIYLVLIGVLTSIIEGIDNNLLPHLEKTSYNVLEKNDEFEKIIDNIYDANNKFKIYYK